MYRYHHLTVHHATHLVYNWHRASDVNLSNYNLCTRAEPAKIKLSIDALQCENVDYTSHRKDIDLFY